MVDRWFKLILIKNLNLNCLPCKCKVGKPAFIFRVNNTLNLFIKNCSNEHSFQALIAKVVASIKSMEVGEGWKERGILGLLTKILQRLSLKIPVSLCGLGRKKCSEKRTGNSRSLFHASFSIYLFFKNQFTSMVDYVMVKQTLPSALKAFTHC